MYLEKDYTWSSKCFSTFVVIVVVSVGKQVLHRSAMLRCGVTVSDCSRTVKIWAYTKTFQLTSIRSGGCQKYGPCLGP